MTPEPSIFASPGASRPSPACALPIALFLLGTGFLALLRPVLDAAVPVPEDLRNPFQPANPTGFTTPQQIERERPNRPTVNPEEEQLNQQFLAVANKLRSLPLRGIISSPQNPNANSALLGTHIFQRDVEIDSRNFGFTGIIRVVSVDAARIIVNISIGLESREIILPLQRTR